MLPAGFVWLPLDTWIVVVAALSAAACAIPGVFLLLRRMSMMGDAISHAVLPGLAIAFLISGTRGSLSMFIGAAVIGVLTAVFTQWVHAAGKVDESASMGVVFTVLFACGLVLIVQAADAVDLDPGCVLYGALEAVAADTRVIAGVELPRAVLTNGGVLLLNALVVALLYKELKLSTFDPALATSLGFDARLMHYLLMTLTAVTTVAAFESVGSILVIAMLIVPAATAHLLTDRLLPMLLTAVGVAAASAGLGHVGAIVVPGWLGFAGASANTAGMIAVASGVLLTGAVFFAPRHGLVSKWLGQLRLSIRIAAEDLLGRLYRHEESVGRAEKESVGWAESSKPSGRAPASEPPLALHTSALIARAARFWLARRGLVHAAAPGRLALTAAGRDAAARLVGSHRLWESYMQRHAQLPSDHLHGPAEVLEHVTSPELRERLAKEVDQPTHDPHGKPIP